MKKIIVICGPTGIGKTRFAISIAQRFNGEIISADSLQIYKHMNIGTAKPNLEEREQILHHLIDFLDPRDAFDAGQYLTHADKAIIDITARKKVPVIAGGTGLYIRALLNGLFRLTPVCQKTLSLLNKELEEKGPLNLYQRLCHCDPVAAEKLHPNDSFRVIRALEVYQTSGQRLSEHQKKHGFGDARYTSIKIGLTMERDKLYDRINKRVDVMLDQGLLKEVTTLIEHGYSFDLKPMQSIGYKHMALFMAGKVNWEEAVRLLKRDTRRYAKRQYTWFKKDKDIHWLDPVRLDLAENMIKEFLT